MASQDPNITEPISTVMASNQTSDSQHFDRLSSTDLSPNDLSLAIANFDSSSLEVAALVDTALLAQPTLPPIKQAYYKSSNEDFTVNEIMAVNFSNEGEHLWLHIKKSGMNTAYIAKLLAEWADIPLRDVGYSGLKDRHALTTQWFSLRIPKKQLPETDFAPIDLGDNETVEIIDQHWHNKKLNRGAHRANEFVITLRDIEFTNNLQVTANHALVEQQLQTIMNTGVPNYFGPQRFGRHASNIREALRLFAQPIEKDKPSGKKSERKRVPREQHTMALSAARSVIFNDILSARVVNGSWNTGLAGEVFNLDGSGSIFSSEQLDDTLQARLDIGDIHPTAVMWGIDNAKVSGPAAQLETQVVRQSALLTMLATGLEQREIKAQRRALRLPVETLSWQWLDEQSLVLRFSLTTGSFATSVLASLTQALKTT
ncbi:tRNA pseudouridine(13) synthase TruD [Psychrobacter sp. TAE2020]|uniref:tRNA pseudouridine(13) synthase TruD n=1 Tax=Psychrobacter sp. TAE2020 TaxID=2846762 RepID=UPI001E5E9646|nr:tRNA pseudouridine(13) synthase TruD [Psychrobacter sp. TAE2020]